MQRGYRAKPSLELHLHGQMTRTGAGAAHTAGRRDQRTQRHTGSDKEDTADEQRTRTESRADVYAITGCTRAHQEGVPEVVGIVVRGRRERDRMHASPSNAHHGSEQHREGTVGRPLHPACDAHLCAQSGARTLRMSATDGRRSRCRSAEPRRTGGYPSGDDEGHAA